MNYSAWYLPSDQTQLLKIIIIQSSLNITPELYHKFNEWRMGFRSGYEVFCWHNHTYSNSIVVIRKISCI